MIRAPQLELVLMTPSGQRSRSIVLGAAIAKGAAGTVYHLHGDASTVVKIYHDTTRPDDLRTSFLKVEAMLRDPPNLPPYDYEGQAFVQIAWPTGIILKNKKFVGFSMPALQMNRTQVLEVLLLDRQAAKHGLRSNMGTRVTVARQLAGLVAQLHMKGHYVVDMKPVNLSYYPTTLYMAVLDCDGFNVHDQNNDTSYPAPMFTVEYLAPEFQDSGNPNTDPLAQDKFALAVIIFQLLCHGTHPFSGVLADKRKGSSRKDFILRGDFPYGRVRKPGLEPIPSCTYRCLPDELIECFERAFGNDPARRPSAQRWTNLLDKYATPSTNNLVRCGVNPEHRHFAGLPCSRCSLDHVLSGLSPLGLPISQPNRSSTSAQPASSPAPRRTVALRPTAAPKPGKSNDVLVGLGIVAVLVCFGIFVVSQNPTHSNYQTASPTPANHPPIESMATTPTPAPVPTRLTEEIPPVGQDLILSEAQIRYCLAEDIRLDAARTALNLYNQADVDRFNAMIASYNSRCKSFTYHKRDMEIARDAIEPFRSDIQKEGQALFSSSDTLADLLRDQPSPATPRVTVDQVESPTAPAPHQAAVAPQNLKNDNVPGAESAPLDAGVPASGEAPAILVDQGACPFECCQYGRWITTRATPVYAAPDKSAKQVSNLAAGTVVAALTGQVRTVGQRFVVHRQHEKYQPGDTLMVYTYLGEGYFKVWYKGRFFDEDLDFSPSGGTGGERCTDTAYCWGTLAHELKSAWWVQIRLADGSLGWVDGFSNFDGQDACG